jgi:lipoprotein-anchoring transpeptidase ErfK/SrfK
VVPPGSTKFGGPGGGIALFPPYLARTTALYLGDFGGISVRVCTSLALFAFALAGTIGPAAAQYYAPPPPGYQPYPPPPPPGYGPQSYDSAPLPPPGASGYGQPYQGQQQTEAYPPPAPSQPYGQPASSGAFPPQPLPYGAPGYRPPADVSGGGPGSPAVTGTVPAPVATAPAPRSDPSVVAALPADYQPEQNPTPQLPQQFQRQLVDYPTNQPAGTIIVDTPNTYLYLVMGGGKALRYGIGVGREGFTWTGTERISRMKEWPDWFPPKEMIERQPYLPRFMAGGESNPLGARALYLGNTLYRIHGTNQPSTIGTFVSSGCIRLTNTDIADLYDRVQVGTRVVVLPGTPPNTASSEPPGEPQTAISR